MPPATGVVPVAGNRPGPDSVPRFTAPDVGAIGEGFALMANGSKEPGPSVAFAVVDVAKGSKFPIVGLTDGTEALLPPLNKSEFWTVPEVDGGGGAFGTDKTGAGVGC